MGKEKKKKNRGKKGGGRGGGGASPGGGGRGRGGDATGSSSSSSGGGSGDLVGLLPLTSLRAKCLSELGVSDGPLEQLAPSLGVRRPQPCLPLQEVREPRLDGQRCYHVGMDSGDYLFGLVSSVGFHVGEVLMSAYIHT